MSAGGDAPRVAVVAEWYPSPADPVHGIWAHRQAVAAAAAGAEVRVLALRRPVPPLAIARALVRDPRDTAALRAWAGTVRATLAPWTLDGIPVVGVAWLGPPRPLSYPSWGWWMAPPLARALDRLAADWPFDVLHAHTLAPTGHAAARWVSGRRDAPAFVVSAHGPDLYSVPGSRIGRHAVRAALGAADLALANSSWSARRIAALGAPAPPAIEVVHLGATTAADADPAEPASTGRLRLVTVAHLQERKHHHVVLRAIARLPADRRPDYEIVGDGERREALERLVRELGLADRVTFAGQLPNEAAVARVAVADLFVMPSVEEPFGVAFVEAMAAGLPAVGARGEGGPADIAAAGEGMTLVDPDDDAALAALIGELSQDRQRLHALGAAAAATARAHFSWERCGEATVAAYATARRIAAAKASTSAPSSA